MDILLPDINGIDIFRQLQKESLTSSIPVVAITALAMPEERQQILKAGFHGYLTKPYLLEDLEWMIRKHLKLAGINDRDEVMQNV